MNDPRSISARIVKLTPEYAEELLARNPRNRKFSPRNYAVVKRAVERGEWELNGEAIKVSADGYILDGQHRCAAVVETGVPIETFLIEGLPDSTQDTMDTGKSRNLADVLSIRGEINGNGLAALIRRHYAYERLGLAQALGTSLGGAATIREHLDWFHRNEWVRDYVTPGKAMGRTARPLSGATAGFLMRIFDEIDREDSDYFWARLVDGAGLDADSPILCLRQTLKTMALDARGERNQRYIAALVIKAWNAYRDGAPVRQLKYRIGGANPEKFPEPR